MEFEKMADLYDDLIAMAKKHNIMLIMNCTQDSEIKYHFDGFSIYITDGTPSSQKISDIKNGVEIQESSTILSKSNSKFIKVKKIKWTEEKNT